MRPGRGLAFASIDFLVCVTLWMLMQLAPPPKPASAVRTYGVYAVVLTWPGNRPDDLDLYVQDPQGLIVYFAAKNSPVAHLEHDDLATEDTGYHGADNFERTVIRVAAPGEYVANVHDYRHFDKGPVPARVELWRLQGADEVVVTAKLLIRGLGDEQTAFRWTIRPDGSTASINRLPKELVGKASER